MAGRSWRRICGDLLLMTGLTLALGEALVRVLRPSPPVQIVRPGKTTSMDLILDDIDGVPVWPSAHDAERYDLDCPDKHPDAPRVLVLGSSILAATGLEPERSFSVRMKRELQQSGHHVCMINLAEGGYTFANQLAVASEVIPRLQPDVVYWEVWQNSPFEWTTIGDSVYRWQGLEVGHSGVPTPFGVPIPFSRWLFEVSRLFEFATITLAPRQANMDEEWTTLVEQQLPKAVELVEQAGSHLTLVFCPPLSRPFAEWTADQDTLGPSSLHMRYATVMEFAETLDIPTLHLAEALVDDPVEDVRMDRCCHYSDHGHRRLAEIFLADLAMLAPEIVPAN